MKVKTSSSVSEYDNPRVNSRSVFSTCGRNDLKTPGVIDPQLSC